MTWARELGEIWLRSGAYKARLVACEDASPRLLHSCRYDQAIVTHPPQLTFEALLDLGEPLLLDGGLATQLEAMGHVIDTPLWSAELLTSAPQAIVEAHRAFLRAGAVGVITASYQLSRLGLSKSGIPGERFEDLLRRSIELAREACREHDREESSRPHASFVAASVGPYGAALADGSEYRGDYDLDDAALAAFHSERLEFLDTCGADVLACETIPSQREARVLSELLTNVATPAWVSFSCQDSKRMNDGSELRRAAEIFVDHPRVLALGVNCSAPPHITGAIGELRAGAPGKRIVVYPNSGEDFDGATHRWSGPSTQFDLGGEVRTWRRSGADLIGGCCRVSPAHIREMAQALSASG